jgi:hypothetical protein
MTDVHVRLVTLQNRENCSTVTKCFRTWPYSRAGAAVAVNAALALAAALVLPPLLGRGLHSSTFQFNLRRF